MSSVHPAKVTTAFVALVAVTMAMHVVSRTTGSGWLVVVVSFLLSVLGLSIVLPVRALAGAESRSPRPRTPPPTSRSRSPSPPRAGPAACFA